MDKESQLALDERPTTPLMMSSLRISCESSGSGPPLVLLHGIGSSARSWRKQLDGLSDIRAIIAWDAPGYGGSEDPDPSWTMSDYAQALGDFLDELGLERVDLVGLSFGGVVAAEFCRHDQHRLSSLVLADTHQGGSAKDPGAYRQRLEERLQAFRTKSREEFARDRAARLLSEFASADLFEEVVQIMAEVRSPGYETAAVALAEADVSDILPTIDTPTLVVCGELDRVTPPSEAKEIANAIPGARLEFIEKAGHLCNQEHPQRFNELIRSHLKSSRPKQRSEAGIPRSGASMSKDD